MSRRRWRLRGASLLARLKVRHKLLLGLLAVGLAFVAVVALVIRSGNQTQALFDRIETGEVPALNLRRDLEAALREYQRALQDAAATEDTELLAMADEHRETFLSTLDAGKSNQAMNPELLEVLAAEFDDTVFLAAPVACHHGAPVTGVEHAGRLHLPRCFPRPIGRWLTSRNLGGLLERSERRRQQQPGQQKASDRQATAPTLLKLRISTIRRQQLSPAIMQER